MDDGVLSESERIQNSKSKTNDEDSCFIKNYPFIDAKPIPWNIPSVYYQQRVRLKPPPEPSPPPKLVFRDVDYDKLSEGHKKLAGKSLFEKDLIIIQSKNQSSKVWDNSSDSSDSTIPEKIKANPPSVFKREEQLRLSKKEERDKKERQMFLKKKRQERRRKRLYDKEKRKIDMISKEREAERNYNQQKLNEEKEKEILEKQKLYGKMIKSPQKTTRSMTLRMEVNKHRVEVEKINKQKEKLNNDMRKLREQRYTQKIKSMIDEMNPDQNFASRARQKKENLLKLEKSWKKWLRLTEQTQQNKECMLERIYYNEC